MRHPKDVILSQLGHPRGWLAPLMSRALDRVNRRLNAQVIGMLAPAPGERVLEVGFGGGGGMAHLRRDHPELHLAGAEISTAMLARARRRFRRDLAAGRLELVEASVEALPWPDHSFDAIYTVNTIYFWPDVDAGLRELYRVLVPDGRLILGVESQQSLEKAGFSAAGHHTPSYDDIATWLARAGFRHIRMLEDRARHWAGIRASRPRSDED
ncbi:class I SAM-dependent methyltransferase [Haliangium sp.]|uniref:class I SAM-dependent methyltransferase n=1 Tax=Haliangium sp. TaxID=2663208 RepID=UPI003D0F22A1